MGNTQSAVASAAGATGAAAKKPNVFEGFKEKFVTNNIVQIIILIIIVIALTVGSIIIWANWENDHKEQKMPTSLIITIVIISILLLLEFLPFLIQMLMAFGYIKKYTIVAGVVLILALWACIRLADRYQGVDIVVEDGKGRECPDGTIVYRDADSACEFPECPDSTSSDVTVWQWIEIPILTFSSIACVILGIGAFIVYITRGKR